METLASPLIRFAARLEPAHLLEAARTIDSARTPDDEALLRAHHGFADEALTRLPFAFQAALVARERGIFAGVSGERSALPTAPSWIPALVAPDVGGFRASPVADFAVARSPKSWSRGLVLTLVGPAYWPQIDEWELAHAARLTEAVGAWHWYWLAELGRAYCPRHVVADEGVEHDCGPCSVLEADSVSGAVRAARLATEGARGLVENAVSVLRYEARCFTEGLRTGELVAPQGRYLPLGRAFDAARAHHRTLTSPSFARFAEHCLRRDVDFASSPEALERKVVAVVDELLTPRRPTPEVAALRARRVLQDLGWRVCHWAALQGDEVDGCGASVQAVARGLEQLAEGSIGAEAADAVLAEALGRVAADLGDGGASVLAVGYQPTAQASAEPPAMRAARLGAYRARLEASGSPVAKLARHVPEVCERVISASRTVALTDELARAAPKSKELPPGRPVPELQAEFAIAMVETLLAFYHIASESWGPDQPAGEGDPRWIYRLAAPTLPPPELRHAYRVRPNPYLGAIPLPFDVLWVDELASGRLPVGPTLRPKYTTRADYVAVGPGRRGPVFLPYIYIRKALLDRLRQTPTVAELLGEGGVPEESLRRAIEEELVLCLAMRDPVDLAPGSEAVAAATAEGGAEAAPEARDDVIQSASPAPVPNPWDDPDQAAYYEAFCDRNGLYRDVAGALVAHVGITPDAQVADLGSGTGVSAEAVLAALGPEGQVVGVDPSALMVAAARRRVSDARAEFAEGDARALRQVMPLGPGYSAVLASSSLWLDRDVPEALRCALGSLRRDGRVGLAIPAEYLGHSEHLVADGAAMVLGALREVIGERPAGDSPGAALSPALGSMERLTRLLVEVGFMDIEARLYVRPWTAGEYLDWLGQPAILDVQRPGLDEAGRRELRERLLAAVDAGAPAEARWYLVRARRG